jgi:endonuclease/exonuclease/phosphatase family metal-dependent hydrolase
VLVIFDAAMKYYEPVPEVSFTRFDEGEGILLHLTTKAYYTLNATGVFIWEQLEQKRRSVAEVVEALLAHFDVSPQQAQQQVEAFLEELARQGLVAVVPG